MEDIKLGEKVIEGKTKIVYKLTDHPGKVLVRSKDRITAGDGAKAHDLEGKASISTQTTSAVFEYLNEVGIKTHFIERKSDKDMICTHCHMIPIEWVTRRIATGSFLRRNPGVKEGFKFTPVKLETFYKDDANHDPQWSHEQLVSAGLRCGSTVVTEENITYMYRVTTTVFEVLEKAWQYLDCTLVDMKIEFGISVDTGEILLADVIDNDSWRLWPSGDRGQMKDKQVYREMKEVTEEGLSKVKRNFQWVADKVQLLKTPRFQGKVVVIMGSAADQEHCAKIREYCKSYGVTCDLRVCSAHKSTQDLLNMVAKYEGDCNGVVFIAVAGRSNGLGPVLSANSSSPVINCPPITPAWASQDIWSSLHLPSGLGCGTVISPEAAALLSAQIIAVNDHMVWSKLRAKKLDAWIALAKSDAALINV